MSGTHSETNAVNFNERVEATKFAGSVSARLRHIEDRLERIDERTEKMWATQQRFLGVIAIGSVLLPLVTMLAARVLWP